MNTLTKFIHACALLSIISLPAWAMAQDTLLLTMKSMQEIEVTGKNGKKQKQLVPAAKVVPGSEVIYVITYKNAGDKPADKAVISNAVPKELIYKGGSASGKNAKFEVSVDGGASYGALPSLKVVGADGKTRPAQPADVTHLRWSLVGAVAPGKEGTVSYKADLK